MSAYSTLTISRSKALQMWREYTKVIEPANEQLEEFLDDILHDRLYNAWVVDDAILDCSGIESDDGKI